MSTFSSFNTQQGIHPRFRYSKRRNLLEKWKKHATELYISFFFRFFGVYFLQNKSSSLFFSKKKTVHGLQRANKTNGINKLRTCFMSVSPRLW